MRYFLICLFLLDLTVMSNAQQDSVKIEKEISYTTDFAVNLRGGYQKGFAWLGKLHAIVDLPVEKFGLWKNGSFHLDYLVTHGSPFSSLTGDFQIASNIEAPSLSTFFELWYEHTINNHSFRIGLIDLNAHFLYTDQASSLLNSSFGIQPTLSVNMPVSIFPISALGFVWEADITPWLHTSTGLFDGIASLQYKHQVMPDLVLNINEGIFIIQELHFKAGKNRRKTNIKLGAWIHTGNFESHQSGYYNENFGIYFIADKPLWSIGKGTLYGWIKGGTAPRYCNVIRYFNGGGLTLQNPFGSNEEDIISLAVANAIFCHEFRDDPFTKYNETVLEFTIRKQWKFLSFQPDLQYIINPSGLSYLENALCLIFRINATF